MALSTSPPERLTEGLTQLLFTFYGQREAL